MRWSGIAFVVCFVAAAATYGSGAGRSAAEIAAYYASPGDRARQIAGFGILLAGALCLILFVARLPGTVPLVSGAATAVLLTGANALWAGSAFTAHVEGASHVDPNTHLMFEDTGFALFVAAALRDPAGGSRRPRKATLVRNPQRRRGRRPHDLVLVLPLGGIPRVGRRRRYGEWVIEELFERYAAAAHAKDVEGFLALYADDIRSFDMWGSWSYDGIGEYRAMVEGWFGGLGDERVGVEFDDIREVVGDDVAAASAFVTFRGLSASGEELRSMNNRITWALRRAPGGEWKVVHEHTSAPLDDTAQAIFRRA